MTLGDIVAESSNIGAVMVANRLGASALATYLARFGLGRATGVGFPGESNGIMLPLDQWNDTSLATMAYGQGIAATPLQMVSVYSTIANDGRWVQPKLVRGTIGPDGSLDPKRGRPHATGRLGRDREDGHADARVRGARTAPARTRRSPATRSPARPGRRGSPPATAPATSRASTSRRSSATSRPATRRSSSRRSWIVRRPCTAGSPPPRCSSGSRSPPSPASASRPPTGSPCRRTPCRSDERRHTGGRRHAGDRLRNRGPSPLPNAP